jgi:hypothetical protein
VSDIYRHRSGTGKSYCRTRFDVGLEGVNNVLYPIKKIFLIYSPNVTIMLYFILRHSFFSDVMVTKIKIQVMALNYNFKITKKLLKRGKITGYFIWFYFGDRNSQNI